MFSLGLQVVVGILWGVTNVLMKYSQTTTQVGLKNNCTIEFFSFFFFFCLINVVLFCSSLDYKNSVGCSHSHSLIAPGLSSAVAIANAVSLAASAFSGHCLFKEKLGIWGEFFVAPCDLVSFRVSCFFRTSRCISYMRRCDDLKWLARIQLL